MCLAMFHESPQDREVPQTKILIGQNIEALCVCLTDCVTPEAYTVNCAVLIQPLESGIEHSSSWSPSLSVELTLQNVLYMG